MLCQGITGYVEGFSWLRRYPPAEGWNAVILDVTGICNVKFAARFRVTAVQAGGICRIALLQLLWNEHKRNVTGHTVFFAGLKSNNISRVHRWGTYPVDVRQDPILTRRDREGRIAAISPDNIDRLVAVISETSGGQNWFTRPLWRSLIIFKGLSILVAHVAPAVPVLVFLIRIVIIGAIIAYIS